MAPLTPGDVADIVEYVGRHRAGSEPFDVVVGAAPDEGALRELEEAGATWAVIGPEMGSSLGDMRAMIERGAPRV
jgi:hypothetical protein